MRLGTACLAVVEFLLLFLVALHAGVGFYLGALIRGCCCRCWNTVAGCCSRYLFTLLALEFCLGDLDSAFRMDRTTTVLTTRLVLCGYPF